MSDYACATCGKDMQFDIPQDLCRWDSPSDKRVFCSLPCIGKSAALADTKALYPDGKVPIIETDFFDIPWQVPLEYDL